MKHQVSWRKSEASIQGRKDTVIHDVFKKTSRQSDQSIPEENINIAMLAFKKPTGLKKIVDSVPKPADAIPENGLPTWYRLDLDRKLPLPKYPAGKIVLSRGKVGEDIHRWSRIDTPGITFNVLMNDATFEYSSLHDRHLVNHLGRASIRKKMQELGIITEDGKAVCSLKEFNQYRQYLNIKYKNDIKAVLREMDQKAHDDLTLQRVEEDKARRWKKLREAERARIRLLKQRQWNADQWEEKKRMAKERNMKAKERIRELNLLTEKKRKDQALRRQERRTITKERQEVVAEMEVQNCILKLKAARLKEEKRLNWLKQDREAKAKKRYEEDCAKWEAKIQAENKKIQEEEMLMRIYTKSIAEAAARRANKAKIKAYETDLELQRIRLRNLKMIHGDENKKIAVAKKMTAQYEKTICFKSYSISQDMAHKIANNATACVMALQSDPFVSLAQARRLMFKHAELPSCVVQLMDEIIQAAVMEFTRRLVKEMLGNIESDVRKKCAKIFFADIMPIHMKKDKIFSIYTGSNKRTKKPRWRWPKPVSKEEAVQENQDGGKGLRILKFDGNPSVHRFSMEVTTKFKTVKERQPTPMPSLERLAEFSFKDGVDDLPDATFTAINSRLPERKKTVETMHSARKPLSRLVEQRVEKGMDILLGQITLPSIKRRLEYGEVVEILAKAVVDNRVDPQRPEIQQVIVYLAYRIMLSLIEEMRARRRKRIEQLNLKKSSKKVSIRKDLYRSIDDNVRKSEYKRYLL